MGHIMPVLGIEDVEERFARYEDPVNAYVGGPFDAATSSGPYISQRLTAARQFSG
jgi:hypothetical protein